MTSIDSSKTARTNMLLFFCVSLFFEPVNAWWWTGEQTSQRAPTDPSDFASPSLVSTRSHIRQASSSSKLTTKRPSENDDATSAIALTSSKALPFTVSTVGSESCRADSQDWTSSIRLSVEDLLSTTGTSGSEDRTDDISEYEKNQTKTEQKDGMNGYVKKVLLSFASWYASATTPGEHSQSDSTSEHGALDYLQEQIDSIILSRPTRVPTSTDETVDDANDNGSTKRKKKPAVVVILGNGPGQGLQILKTASSHATSSDVLSDGSPRNVSLSHRLGQTGDDSVVPYHQLPSLRRKAAFAPTPAASTRQSTLDAMRRGFSSFFFAPPPAANNLNLPEQEEDSALISSADQQADSVVLEQRLLAESDDQGEEEEEEDNFVVLMADGTIIVSRRMASDDDEFWGEEQDAEVFCAFVVPKAAATAGDEYYGASWYD